MLHKVGTQMSGFATTIEKFQDAGEKVLNVYNSTGALRNSIVAWSSKTDVSIGATVALKSTLQHISQGGSRVEIGLNTTRAFDKYMTLSDAFKRTSNDLHTYDSALMGVLSIDQATAISKLSAQADQLDQLDTTLRGLMAAANALQSANQSDSPASQAQQHLAVLRQCNITVVTASLRSTMTLVTPHMQALDRYRKAIANAAAGKMKMGQFINITKQLLQTTDGAYSQLSGIQLSSAEFERALGHVDAVLKMTTSMHSSIQRDMLPAVQRSQQAVDVFMGANAANAFSTLATKAVDSALEAYGLGCGDNCSKPVYRRLQRRQLQPTQLDQMSQIVSGMDGVQEKADMLADKVEVALVPMLNTAMSYIDKITAFLQSKVAPYARTAKSKLPLLTNMLQNFMFHCRIFVGTIQDVLSVAKKAVRGNPTLEGAAALADNFIDKVLPFFEKWKAKFDGWILAIEDALTMVENLDAQMLFEMVGQVFDRLNLPGERIMKGISEVVKLVGVMKDIVEDKSIAPTERFDRLRSALNLTMSTIAPGIARAAGDASARLKQAALDKVEVALSTVSDAARGILNSVLPPPIREDIHYVLCTTHRELCDEEARARRLCGNPPGTALKELAAGFQSRLEAGVDHAARTMVIEELCPRLEPELLSRNLTWYDVKPAIDLIDTVAELRQAVKHPELFLQTLERSVSAAAKHYVIVQLRAKLEPELHRTCGITWQDALPALQLVDTVSELRAAIGDPHKLLERLGGNTTAGLAAKRFLMAKLKAKVEPILTTHGVTWDDMTPVLERVDTASELRAALDDPAQFLQGLCKAVGRPAKAFAIAKLKPHLEPLLKAKGIEWQEAVSALELIDTVEELRSATSSLEGASKFLHKLEHTAVGKAAKQLAILKLRKPLESRGLKWDDAIQVLQLVDTAKELRAAFADPDAFVNRLENSAVGRTAKQFMLLRLRRTMEPIVVERLEPLTWSEIVPALELINTASELRKAYRNPAAFLEELESTASPAANKFALAKLRPKLTPHLERLDLSWNAVEPALQLVTSTTELKKALRNPQKFLHKLSNAAMPAARKLAVLKLKPKLEHLLEQQGLSWEDVAPAIDLVDTAAELRAAYAAPQAFLAKLENSAMPAARKLAVLKLKPKLEHLIEGEGLSWEVIAPDLHLVDSIKQLQDAYIQPKRFLEALLNTDCNPAAKAVAIQLLKPKIMDAVERAGLSWDDIQPILELVDTVSELRNASHDPQTFLTSLETGATPAAKKLAALHLKPQLAHALEVHGYTWEQIEPAIILADSAQELRDAVSNHAVHSKLQGSQRRSLCGTPAAIKSQTCCVSTIDDDETTRVGKVGSKTYKPLVFRDWCADAAGKDTQTVVFPTSDRNWGKNVRVVSVNKYCKSAIVHENPDGAGDLLSPQRVSVASGATLTLDNDLVDDLISVTLYPKPNLPPDETPFHFVANLEAGETEAAKHMAVVKLTSLLQEAEHKSLLDSLGVSIETLGEVLRAVDTSELHDARTHPKQFLQTLQNGNGEASRILWVAKAKGHLASTKISSSPQSLVPSLKTMAVDALRKLSKSNLLDFKSGAKSTYKKAVALFCDSSCVAALPPACQLLAEASVSFGSIKVTIKKCVVQELVALVKEHFPGKEKYVVPIIDALGVIAKIIKYVVAPELLIKDILVYAGKEIVGWLAAEADELIQKYGQLQVAVEHLADDAVSAFKDMPIDLLKKHVEAGGEAGAAAIIKALEGGTAKSSRIYWTARLRGLLTPGLDRAGVPWSTDGGTGGVKMAVQMCAVDGLKAAVANPTLFLSDLKMGSRQQGPSAAKATRYEETGATKAYLIALLECPLQPFADRAGVRMAELKPALEGCTEDELRFALEHPEALIKRLEHPEVAEAPVVALFHQAQVNKLFEKLGGWSKLQEHLELTAYCVTTMYDNKKEKEWCLPYNSESEKFWDFRPSGWSSNVHYVTVNDRCESALFRDDDTGSCNCKSTCGDNLRLSASDPPKTSPGWVKTPDGMMDIIKDAGLRNYKKVTWDLNAQTSDLYNDICGVELTAKPAAEIQWDSGRRRLSLAPVINASNASNANLAILRAANTDPRAFLEQLLKRSPTGSMSSAITAFMHRQDNSSWYGITSASRELLSSLVVGLAKASGLSALVDVSAEIYNVSQYMYYHGTDVQQLATMGTLVGTVMDAFLNRDSSPRSEQGCVSATGVVYYICTVVNIVRTIGKVAEGILVPLLLQLRAELGGSDTWNRTLDAHSPPSSPPLANNGGSFINASNASNHLGRRALSTTTKCKKGDSVVALWRGNNRQYTANIVEINTATEHAIVDWDDGGKCSCRSC
eukprot:COSAG01_NODE_1644_length_9640_cov_6.926213_2_plen_2326_part_00